MQVFTLQGSVTPTPTVNQAQLALTDGSEGQQSYSEDVATLLATMEQALGQLDSTNQQDQVTTPTPEPDPGLVLSIQSQSLLFAPSLPTATPLTESIAAEQSGQLSDQGATATSLVFSTPELQTEHRRAVAAFYNSGLSGTGQRGAIATLTPVTPVLLQDVVAQFSAPLSLTQAQTAVSTDLQPSLTQLQSGTSAGVNSLMALVQSTLLNQTAPILQNLAVMDSSVSTLTPVSGTATSALPVWQADPLPVQSPQWGQRLLQMLADKVDLQLGLQVNRAMIRLDPPSLGSIELSVQLDGDRLTVQMHSSNAQLRDAMGQGLELLRASLQQKLGSEVQIDLRMGSDSSSSQHQQQKMPVQPTQQPDANFYSEPEVAGTDVTQPNRLNLVNQLV